MKKNKFRFIIFKKIYIFAVFILIITLAFCAIIPTISASAIPIQSGYCVVIDAGHGGIDGGSVGTNGTVEKTINLQYALALKQYLTSAKIKTVLTRTNDDGLYDIASKNKKLSDMNRRAEIINKHKPDLVISIHMNSFSQKSVWGANSFYDSNSQSSKLAAQYIQYCLSKYAETYVCEPKIGDYFILNCTEYTSVLVECGFLSNAKEEQALNTEDYKNLITYSIYCGIVQYLGIFNY